MFSEVVFNQNAGRLLHTDSGFLVHKKLVLCPRKVAREWQGLKPAFSLTFLRAGLMTVALIFSPSPFCLRCLQNKAATRLPIIVLQRDESVGRGNAARAQSRRPQRVWPADLHRGLARTPTPACRVSTRKRPFDHNDTPNGASKHQVSCRRRFPNETFSSYLKKPEMNVRDATYFCDTDNF